MKKIYITGLAGMLGSNLAYLLKNEYEIYGCDRNVLDDMEGVYGTVFDIAKEGLLEQELLRIRPDVIINTAALVNVDGCEQNLLLAESMNAKLPERIRKVCEHIEAHLIQISTDAVYQDSEGVLHKEEDAIEPQNEYAKTKYQGELCVQDYPMTTVIRTNVYGFNMRDKCSFGEWVLKAFQNGTELNMVEDVKFSPILVNDLSAVIHKIIEQQVYGLYNVCATGGISKYEFGIYMREIFDYPEAIIHKITSEQLHLKAPRSKNMAMDNHKICEKLQMKIRTPQESIEEFKRLYAEGYARKIKAFGGYQS